MTMKKTAPAQLATLLFATAALLAAPKSQSAGHKITDNPSLPDSLRPGYIAPIDGPVNDRLYAGGNLKLIRPTYGRASLYVAWRAIHAPIGSLGGENRQRRGDMVNGMLPPPQRGADQINAWLQLRGTLAPQPPAAAPDYFRHAKMQVPGFGQVDSIVGQCGADAYAFATTTLKDLVGDTSLKDAERRAWIAGQDSVFAQCAWSADLGTAPPPLPEAVSARAPDKLKALNAYQHAAALFYRDEFVAARKEFDAIATQTRNPMRPWAILAAMRCDLRDAVRGDKEWEAAFQDAWNTRGLRDNALTAAIAQPAAAHRARTGALFADLASRAKAAVEDASLAPIRQAVGYTMRRAYQQLSPGDLLDAAMAQMEKPEYNPYTMSAIDMLRDVYPSVAPERPQGAAAAKLRKHEWFDFVVAVQGCADGPHHPLDVAACDSEHAHAMERWQASKDNAWLLAALMTARQPAEPDLPAALAARAVPENRPEWASLQYYAARVLRTQGRAADAHAAVQAIAVAGETDARDRELLEAELR